MYTVCHCSVWWLHHRCLALIACVCATALLYIHAHTQMDRIAVIEVGDKPPTGTQDILARTVNPSYMICSMHPSHCDIANVAPMWSQEGTSLLEPSLVSCPVSADIEGGATVSMRVFAVHGTCFLITHM